MTTTSQHYELRQPGRENYSAQLVLVIDDEDIHVADVDLNPKDPGAAAGAFKAILELANGALAIEEEEERIARSGPTTTRTEPKRAEES